MVHEGEPAHYLRLKVSIGTLLFSWNDQEKITGISWQEWHRPGANRGFLLTSRKIPIAVEMLIEDFWNFFEYGKPIPRVPWESIDETTMSDFQRKVFEACSIIPHGETRPYGWIAERIWKPNAHRAVGQALRRNPFCVLVPCHRVISAQGGMGGFLGKANGDEPELQLKRKLLDIEFNYKNPVFGFLSSNYDPIQVRTRLKSNG
ncbi:MAG: hypothetical protein CL678_05840 [Bdellovibrionaceae bacterium]|nr:hypothetical protein [Pseudobdellovibrionaceae bacterium]|tara:strand:- start:3385 stop:3996 length:612 start_codon:yes stop_codon:yes gene_type:complete